MNAFPDSETGVEALRPFSPWHGGEGAESAGESIAAMYADPIAPAVSRGEWSRAYRLRQGEAARMRRAVRCIARDSRDIRGIAYPGSNPRREEGAADGTPNR